VASKNDLDVQRIEELVRRRADTDRRMGYSWMVVPLLPVLAAIAIGAAVVGLIASAIPKISNISQQPNPQGIITPMVGSIVAIYGLAFILLYAVLLLTALGFYYLIDRRNRHVARQQLLFSTLQRYLTTKISASENVSRLGQLTEDSVYEERSRPAGLWAVLFLFVTPIVGLIAAYNLTQDLRKHDDLQSSYQTTLVNAFGEAGFQPSSISPYKFHKRDPVLFIILSAITAGLFWVYWFYTLLKDFNEHFADQARFEDQILSLLKPQEVRRFCKTCGGEIPAVARYCPGCGTLQTA